MKKSELKKYMIVETGYDNKKYLVVCNTLIDDNLKGYDLDFCFDDDLINKKFKPESISKVYEPVPLHLPFHLDIEKIFEEYKPKLLWERKPTKVSKKLLSSMNEEQGMEYLNGLVFPILIVE